MNDNHTTIWEHLKIHALGMDNAIEIGALAGSLGFPPKGTNNDDVRKYIKELVIEHGKPIGTCNKGVFVILNDLERESAALFVERENRAVSVRRNGNYNPE